MITILQTIFYLIMIEVAICMLIVNALLMRKIRKESNFYKLQERVIKRQLEIIERNSNNENN